MNVKPWLISEIVYPVADIVNGTSIMETYRFVRTSQWWKREKIQEFQFTKLKRLLHHAYQRVPYYRRLLRNENLYPSDIKRLVDIERIPVLTKDSIRTADVDMVSRNQPARRGIKARTGGSTGNPMKFYRDKNARSWAWGAMFRFFEWAGTKVGDKRVTVGGGSLGGYLRGKSLYSSAARLLDILQGNYFYPAFMLDNKMIAAIANLIKNRNISVIRGYPSTLYLIARNAESLGVDFSNISICLSTAEKLYHIKGKQSREYSPLISSTNTEQAKSMQSLVNVRRRASTMFSMNT